MSRVTPCCRAGFVLLVALAAIVGSIHVTRSEPLTPTPTPTHAAGVEIVFHHDHVIGTSLDLRIVAPDELTAEKANFAVLDEIERLRMVFSTYEPASEITRLNATRERVAVSRELSDVLYAYDLWQRKTGGVFNGQVGELVRVWKEAEKTGELPPPATLERIARDVRKPGWDLDAAGGTVSRTTDQPLNLNALAKAYIIRAAADVVRKQVPSVTGLLINLGGDILAVGPTDWGVGVQDPFRHFDNAAPLAGLRLRNQAVASSGGYQRFYTIGGKQYSHIFDPRTGRSAEGVAGATVVASDNLTANALATTLCVLSPEEGLKLVAATPGAECLIVAADGKQFRSHGLKLLEVVPGRTAEPVVALGAEDAWPAGYQVTVAVELPKIDAKRYRKPYAAIWIEDDQGKPVRTLAVWGNAPKYLKDLSDWWKFARNDNALIKAVTRATRGPGKYDLVWDGKDEKGKPVPQGTYTVRVEVHREFGAHLRQSGKIECKGEPATTKFEKNAETGETVVEFKKAAKK